MSITDQAHTSHPTRTGVIAGLCVALAVGAALTVAAWDRGTGQQTPAVDRPSYAEQVAALSDEQLAGAFNYTHYPIYQQIAALSDERLAGAFNYTHYPINEPVSVTSVNERISDALAAGDLDLSASFALGDAELASLFSGRQ